MAALDRAFALAEIDDRAVPVGQHLDLDMPRLLDEPLDEDAVVAEAGLRLAARQDKAFARLRFVMRDAHALAAAAGRGLDHDRIADLGGDADRGVHVRHHVGIAGHGADAGLLGEALGFDLVAHRRDRLRLGADEGDAFGLQPLGEAGILGQEAEARMDGLRAALLRRRDDPVGYEIALRGGRGADRDRLVRHPDMQRPGVRLGIDGDRLYAHPVRRAHDPAGDLAPVRDQDLREHVRPSVLVLARFPDGARPSDRALYAK